jgi:hypothetical protein
MMLSTGKNHVELISAKNIRLPMVKLSETMKSSLMWQPGNMQVKGNLIFFIKKNLSLRKWR